MEIWKDIIDYEGLYQASNLGRIKSLDRTIVYSDGRSYNYKSQILKSFKNNSGYLQVCLYKNGKMKKYLVHRLVYEAFNGPIPEGMQCNHISEVKTENNLENLNLLTCKENINFGNHSKKQKISQKHKPVLQFDLNDNLIKEWNGVREIESVTGFFHDNISRCCNGRYKQAYGFRWKYKEKVA